MRGRFQDQGGLFTIQLYSDVPLRSSQGCRRSLRHWFNLAHF
jgi:hypothetical protein